MRLTEQLALLIELQKTESAAGRIQARKRDLPLQMEELEKEFRALCAVVEAQREQLEALRKRRREKDTQLQTGQETLKRTRERLFEVKTNKEYQSMLKEIETLEAKNSRMEDEIISLLDELDHLETAVKAKEEELNVSRQRFEEEKAKLAPGARTPLRKSSPSASGKAMRSRKKIPAELLRKYEQIKSDQARPCRRVGLEGGVRRVSYVHSSPAVQRTAEVDDDPASPVRTATGSSTGRTGTVDGMLTRDRGSYQDGVEGDLKEVSEQIR